ncbi:MAG: adenylyl-sulfate kinase [Nitrospiraceae bacterium]|nr:adenylyl-sulfate kinase [Nitrospiraceae bacterium]
MSSKSNEHKDRNVVWHNSSVLRQDREYMNGHKSAVLWFTGLSNSGKSTVAHALEKALFDIGCRTFVFDGDNVRHGLCSDLGFSMQDRKENIRRIGEMSKLFIENGNIAITAFISPFRSERERVRHLIGSDSFIEIYCKCPIEICEKRDVKGHYKRARMGDIKDFTGISSPYEEPLNPEVTLETDNKSVEAAVDGILNFLVARKIIKALETKARQACGNQAR